MYSSPVDVKTFQNQILSDIQTVYSKSGFWIHFSVAMRLRLVFRQEVDR
jgi:hypothetical protein